MIRLIGPGLVVMPMDFKTLLISVVMAASLLSVFAAASPDGATVTSVGNSRYAGTAAQTQSVIAGSIYQVNLNAQSSTNYWAAAWGNVSGSVQLRDSNGHDFLTWNVASGLAQENPGQNVYSTILAVNSGNVPKISSLNFYAGMNLDAWLGISSTLTDSAQNLFTNTAPTVVIGNKTLSGGLANTAFCPVTYNASSGTKNNADCNYPTLASNDSSGDTVFLTAARPIVWTGGNSKKLYDNASFANYQMLLYANDSGTSAATTYSFYMELR